jgi:hypothetical protein
LILLIVRPNPGEAQEDRCNLHRFASRWCSQTRPREEAEEDREFRTRQHIRSADVVAAGLEERQSAAEEEAVVDNTVAEAEAEQPNQNRKKKKKKKKNQT